jgi:hypothetical protein
MKNFQRLCAVALLTITLAISAFAGQIPSPGYAPPPPSEASTSTSGNIKATIILTILSLIR